MPDTAERASLTEVVRDATSSEEFRRIASVAQTIDRNRRIRRTYERLRGQGMAVEPACKKIAADLPHRFSWSSVKSIVYRTR